MCLCRLRTLIPTALVWLATGPLAAGCESAQSAPAASLSAPSSGAPVPSPTSSATLSSAGTLPAPSPWSPRTLTIASWNLEWLSAANNHGPVPRDDAAFARLGRYAARLNADVIAVQEVESVDALARVFDPARYAFYVTADKMPQRTGFVYDKRLSVHVHPDYSALNVGSLRSGADLSVNWNGTSVRLLSVHLKSGCFSEPLTHDETCAKLRAQIPKLEAWIDTRASDPTPFAVLGDFNRRLFATSRDPVWRALDDGQPPESDLSSPTEGLHNQCWRGQNSQFIDHIVLSRSLGKHVVPHSFVQQLYDASDAPYRKQLSDHCPIALRLSVENPPLSAPTAPDSVTTPSTMPLGSAPNPGASARSLEASARSLDPNAQGLPTAAQGLPTAAQGLPTAAQGPSPSAQGPSPSAQGPSPSAQGPSPSAQGPSPSAQGLPSSARGPAPATRGSAAGSQSSAPTAQTSAAGSQGPPASSGGSATGLVKGNRSRKGERYYHTPDCPHYAQVKVNATKGESYFTDEAAAQAAGYQRSPDCQKR